MTDTMVTAPVRCAECGTGPLAADTTRAGTPGMPVWEAVSGAVCTDGSTGHNPEPAGRHAAPVPQRECTPLEAGLWHDRYSAGYSHARTDWRRASVRTGALIEIPAEVPGETGAQYVARHFDLAYRIGYTRAYLWYTR